MDSGIVSTPKVSPLTILFRFQCGGIEVFACCTAVTTIINDIEEKCSVFILLIETRLYILFVVVFFLNIKLLLKISRSHKKNEFH